MNIMKITKSGGIIALAFIVVLIVSSCTLGASRKASQSYTPTYNARPIPQDPTLPSYTNPQEIDLAKNTLHLSFKGLFRGVDEFGRANDWVYFVFTATSQEDIYLAVSQSELYDSRAKIYEHYTVPNIGGTRAFGREIIAGISVPVIIGVNMPLAEAGEFPSVSRITITFNGESLQFRNIVAEDWATWESLRDDSGL